MTSGAAGRRGPGRGFVVLGALALMVLIGLGVWQIQRLAWKNDLIARVDARLAAAPVEAPGPGQWPNLTQDASEYLRVAVSGHYVPGQDALVQAVTTRGSGFWVMAPFETEAGWRVLVNRGFVPADRREPEQRPVPEGLQDVTGLLRLSQPGGAFLRNNDPEAGRWFSRDTQAIAQTLGSGNVAPYFIDADAGPVQDALPIGGLTIVSFPNKHLGYAFTWFALAAALAYLMWRAFRRRDDTTA